MKNIILITVDALRGDHVGFMGYEKNITPNIDNLAKQSIIFDNAFSVGPTTPYSFPAILTSTYGGPDKTKKEKVFISEVLKNNGFTTAAFHSSPYLSDYFGYNKGWDYFEDISVPTSFSSGSSLNRLFRKVLMAISPQLFFKIAYGKYRIKKPKNVKVRASFINQTVKDFISSTEKPFFIWIHYMDIHTPPLCYAENRTCSYSELIGDYVSSALWTYGNKGALRRFIKKNFKKYIGETISSYDNAIKYLDKEIGDLMEFLKKENVYDNSIICLSADHGDEFLEHGGIGHNIELYNELLHVPLAIKIPGRGSERIKNKVSLIDLSPTLCQLVGIEPDISFKGKSLFEHRDMIFHYGSDKISCQSDSWKYILNNKTGEEELYNLDKDKGEQNNISDPKMLSYFRERIEQFKKENNFQPKLCPVCQQGKQFSFIIDNEENSKLSSLFECKLCRAQFWVPFKSSSAEWYEELYQKTNEYKLNYALKSNINRGYHKEFFKIYKDLPKDTSILDLGCGTGEFIAELKKRGYNVWGVDFGKDAINIAKNKFALDNVYNTSFADFFARDDLPKFDIITFFEIIEHIDNPLEFIQNVKKVLKPGGRIVLSTPCRDRFLVNLSRWDFPPHHLLRWNKESIANLFKKIGFTICHIDYKEELKHLIAASNAKFRMGLVNKTMKKSQKKPTALTRIVYIGACLKEYIIGGIPALCLWIFSKITGRKNGVMLIGLKNDSSVDI